MLEIQLKKVLQDSWINSIDSYEEKRELMIDEFDSENIPEDYYKPVLKEFTKSATRLQEILNHPAHDLVENIQEFLRIRWACILNTNAAYCEYPSSPINQLCIALGTLIAIAQNKPIAVILMPTLSLEHVYAYESLQETTEKIDAKGQRIFTPHRFVVSIYANSIINLADWFEIQESPYNPSFIYLHGNNIPLDSDEKRLLRSSIMPFSETFFKHIDECKIQTDAGGTLHFDMLALIKGLKAGGKNAMGAADDLAAAGIASHHAAHVFLQVWDKVAQQEKDNLMSHFSTINQNNFKLYITVLRKATYINLSAEDEAYLVEKNIQPHQTCVESTANILEEINNAYRSYFLAINTKALSSKHESNSILFPSSTEILHKKLLDNIKSYFLYEKTYGPTTRHAHHTADFNKVLEIYFKEVLPSQINSLCQLYYLDDILSEEKFAEILDAMPSENKDEILSKCTVHDDSVILVKLLNHGANHLAEPQLLFMAYDADMCNLMWALFETPQISDMLDIKSADEDSLLSLAVENNNKKLVKKILEKGKSALLFEQDDEMATVLHRAAAFGFDEIFAQLLNKGGAKLAGCLTNAQKTAVEIAYAAREINILIAYLEFIDQNIFNSDNNKNDIRMAILGILESKKNIDAQLVIRVMKKSHVGSSFVRNIDNRSFLHLAIINGQEQIVIGWIEFAGLSCLNDHDIHHKTPLEYIDDSQSNFFQELLKILSDINALSDHNKDIIFGYLCSLMKNDTQAFCSLMKNPGLLLIQNSEKSTLLEHAHRMDKIDAFKQLLLSGPPNLALIKNTKQETILTVLFDRGEWVYCSAMINILGLNYFYSHRDELDTLLLCSIRFDIRDLFTELLAEGPQDLIFATHPSGLTALQLARDLGRQEYVDTLLTIGGRTLLRDGDLPSTAYTLLGLSLDKNLDNFLQKTGFQELCNLVKISSHSHEALSLYGHAIKIYTEKRSLATPNQKSVLSLMLGVFDLKLKNKATNMETNADDLRDAISDLQGRPTKKYKVDTFFPAHVNELEVMPESLKNVGIMLRAVAGAHRDAPPNAS